MSVTRRHVLASPVSAIAVNTVVPYFCSSSSVRAESKNDRLNVGASGHWKLHVHRPPLWPDSIIQNKDWVDPRGPDGVTILAPREQYGPAHYPGTRDGDPPTDMMLFDLQADPAERRKVAAEHPEVVARLKRLYDKLGQPDDRPDDHVR